MMVPAVLLLLGALTAVIAPRLIARADWPDREPVVALWAWQCVVAAVLLCCALSMTLSAAAAWQAVRGHVFAFGPALGGGGVRAGRDGPLGGGDSGGARVRRAVERRDARAGGAAEPGRAPVATCRTPVACTAVAGRGVRVRPTARPGGRAARRLVAGGRRTPTGGHHSRVAAPEGAPAGCGAGARAGARPGTSRLVAELLVRTGHRLSSGTGVRRVPRRDAPTGRVVGGRHGLPALRPHGRPRWRWSNSTRTGACSAPPPPRRPMFRTACTGCSHRPTASPRPADYG